MNFYIKASFVMYFHGRNRADESSDDESEAGLTVPQIMLKVSNIKRIFHREKL